MSVNDGIILKGNRIVIPLTLRQPLLNQLHYGHQGAEKCKLRAKGAVFWHGINSDIDKLVGGCSTCQANQPASSAEPLHPHDVPPRSWHTVASDPFHWEQKDYLVVSDMYSEFPIVRRLHSTIASAVISQLKGIFDEHGVPEKFMSDNGPQYTADKFRVFATQYGFTHKTSSPHYPTANGFIERTLQTVKRLFTKARESGSDPHLAMLCLRSTPIDHHTPSPGELLNGRRYKANIPVESTLRDGHVNDSLQRRQDNDKRFHDRRHPRDLPPLRPDESVRVRDPAPNAGNRQPSPPSTVTPARTSYRRPMDATAGTDDTSTRQAKHSGTSPTKTVSVLTICHLPPQSTTVRARPTYTLRPRRIPLSGDQAAPAVHLSG